MKISANLLPCKSQAPRQKDGGQAKFKSQTNTNDRISKQIKLLEDIDHAIELFGSLEFGILILFGI